MAIVKVIPAKKKIRHSAEAPEKPKLKVAAYCRVSTDSDEQATSYEAQVEHYTTYIRSNPDWECAGIYADDGISGTNTKKREEFNRMIQDCMDGKIEMVITKSISRFARNTLDCLQYIRKLKDRGIPVYFEKENINTMDAKGEVLLTIMASLAQQESQSLSQNVKIGLQYRYQSGKVKMNYNRFLGYTKGEDGNLVVVPEEAAVVRRIFREYLAGESLWDICHSLMRDDIRTGAGKTKWVPSTVRRILSNEKYIGDALLQKTYTVDFLTKKRVKNRGIVPQYYVEGSQEAIVSKEVFRRTQEEIFRRANMRAGKSQRRRTYSSKYALSGMVLCSRCGEIYRRIIWTQPSGKKAVWRCVTRVEHGPEACDSPTIHEEVLHQAVTKAINETLGDKSHVLETVKENLRQVMDESLSEQEHELETKIDTLHKMLAARVAKKEAYDDLAGELTDLMEKKQSILSEQAEMRGKRGRMEEMIQFLNAQTETIPAYDDALTRRLIETVYVNTDTNFRVLFKSGTEVTVEVG